MKEFYIYEEQMDGEQIKMTMFDITGERADIRKPLIITAEDKEAAKHKFVVLANISDEASWMYAAGDKQVNDAEDEILKESGCSSWDEYLNEMNPPRPIEV